MGLFSWKTQDTFKSISVDGNPAGIPTFTVYMHDNTGNVWEESNYQGYGVFGGKDYYELLAEMNGMKTRDEGIQLEFDYGPKVENILYPNLTETKNWKWRNEHPLTCKHQGYFYPFKEDDKVIDDKC